MKKSEFMESQIVSILKEADSGVVLTRYGASMESLGGGRLFSASSINNIGRSRRVPARLQGWGLTLS